MSQPASSVWTELWGARDTPGAEAAWSSGHRYLALPSTDDPRLVVPTRPHRAAAVILRALRDQTSSRARIKTAFARSAVFLGIASITLPDPKVLPELVRHLPAGDYCYGVHFGPRRANRKPVLALATTDGRLAAFAKCGVDSLTDGLVLHEARTLDSLADLTSVRVPHVLGSGVFGGHPYVVQQPVRPQGSRRVNPSLIVAAQREVAALGASTVDQQESLAATTLRWKQRATHPTHAGIAKAFADLAEQWAETMQAVQVPWGSWHGDWRPTNMAVGASGCSVWDWERFATGVPAGYDALHLFLTRLSPSTPDPASLPRTLFDNCDQLLRPFGVNRRSEAEAVTTGYLLELAGRYLDDEQGTAGSPLGSVEDWLLPYLSARQTTNAAGDLRRGAAEA